MADEYGSVSGQGRAVKEAKGALVRAADEYGRRLDGRKEFSRMSDVTGFSPETVDDAARRAKAAGITEKDWSGPGLFSGSRLAALMEKMTEMPETRLADVIASKTFDRGALGEIVSDRISGSPYRRYPWSISAGPAQIPVCVQAIYGKISQCARGLSAMRQACSAEGGANLPAMVYYGVDTDAAVLMRMSSVPRGAAAAMGTAYAAKRDVRGSKPSEAREWLAGLGGPGWDAAARACPASSTSASGAGWTSLPAGQSCPARRPRAASFQVRYDAFVYAQLARYFRGYLLPGVGVRRPVHDVPDHRICRTERGIVRQADHFSPPHDH